MGPEKNLPKMRMQPLPGREPPRPPQARPRISYVRRRASLARRPAGGLLSSGLMLQCLACVLVLLLVLGVQRLNVPVGEGIIDGLHFVIAENAPGTEWVSQQALAVFGQGGSSLCAPAQGEGTRDEGGATVYTAAGPVVAVAEGTVFYMGSDSDGVPYLCLRHGEGLESRYSGLELPVRVGQELRRGDVLGEIREGETLHFTLTQDGALVDPATLKLR